jgi:hypothetical protein
MSKRRLPNWIIKYAEAVDKMSESPVAFNVWCGLSVIGSVMKKRTWIQRGLYKIYPNQYIVLVAPPGIGKGAAMHPALSFAKSCNPALANYMSDRITAPKIIERLAAGFPSTSIINGAIVQGVEASATLQATELAVFLGSSDWMTQFLCDAWDRGEYEYDTKNKGTNLVKDMCVSLIGACVPEFVQSINRDRATAINGGFTARTIFVFAREKSKSIVWPFGFDDPRMAQLKADLEHDLHQITKLSGEFAFDPIARVEFERFYNSIKIEEDDTEVVSHFKSRQPIHVMKTAMCFSAATRDDMVIDRYCLTTAIRLIDQIRATLDITFRGVGESPLAEATARIQTYIERKAICARSEILRDNHRHVVSEDLDRVLMVLESIGFCERFTQGGKQFYRHLGKVSNNGNGKNQSIGII